MELKASDIARRHGIDRKTAYRWLVALEKKHGSEIVTRRGRVLVTSDAAFAKVAPLVADNRAELHWRKEMLERIEDAERRTDKTAERLGALEREVQALRGLRR